MNFIKRNPIIFILTGKAGNGKNISANIISKIYAEKNLKTINLAYASYLKGYAKNILAWDGTEETKPREFLQAFGVDLIKKQIDDHFVINRMLEDIKIYSYFYDVITISDARFIEEIEEIKNIYDKVVVIHIYGKNNNLTEKEKLHISETALDNYKKYDFEINNNGTIEELEINIRKIINEVNS